MIAYPLITDSHCHLDFPDFNDGLDDIVERAAQNGVHRMVTICTRLTEEPKVRAIAERYENVFYAAGTHPMNAAKGAAGHDRRLIIVERTSKICCDWRNWA